MSKTKPFLVAKCYATKSPDAKYSHILHLAVDVEIPVFQDGKQVGVDKARKYIRKGSNFAVAEESILDIQIDQYNVTSHETEWIDEATQEVRNGVEHWLSPKVMM